MLTENFNFGLFTSRNTTVMAVLFVCALVAASSLFLILELDQPLGGLIKISSDPLLNALALPNAAWFFSSSPASYLSFRDDKPGNGFLAQVFNAPSTPLPPTRATWRKICESESSRTVGSTTVFQWRGSSSRWRSESCRVSRPCFGFAASASGIHPAIQCQRGKVKTNDKS